RRIGLRVRRNSFGYARSRGRGLGCGSGRSAWRPLGIQRCRQRHIVRVIGPEHEKPRKQQRRKRRTEERPLERTDQGRKENERGEHRDVAPVHARPIDRQIWDVRHYRSPRVALSWEWAREKSQIKTRS